MAQPAEIPILRIAYLLLFITLGLMTWAYIVRAEALPFQSSGPNMAKGQTGTVLDDYPPCSFNPLCKCSNPGPTDFGIVSCHRIPFANLPLTLKSSRAFVLSMIDNGLDFLADRQLTGAALWRLEIRRNKLNSLGDDALMGLEKSLWELDLRNNELTHIPSAAIRRLLKLKLLDLSWNKITDVDAIDFQGLNGSLTCLSLAGNLLVHIAEDTFINLPKLQRLDLSYNSLRTIHASAFFQNTGAISYIHLAGNLLRKIPFESLSDLNLEYLDLSNNLITSTYDTLFYKGKLHIQRIRLDGNQISLLEPFAFQNMEEVTWISLRFNPISSVKEDAFNELPLHYLDLSHCAVTDVHPASLNGLQSFLQELNLSFNNISSLPFELFEGFLQLQTLDLDENWIMMNPTQLDHLRYTLQKLSLTGDRIYPVPLADLKNMRNLRKLNISTHSQTDALSPDIFDGFGPAVEEIQFSRSKLKSIKNEAFLHIPGVKVIDLSLNRINRIDNDAFAHVGHSVLRLRLNSALRMTTVSPIVWEELYKLQELDLSGNNLRSVPEESFLKNKDLTYLNLRFNSISELSPHLFETMPRLHRIFLSFNSITAIYTETFHRLKDLELIQLNENQLETLQPRAFSDLTNLRILDLAGNQLNELDDEIFQNSPKLQRIDLSYNKLTNFNIEAFEQIGTLSHFEINLSHNKISTLSPVQSPHPHGHLKMNGNSSMAETIKPEQQHAQDIIPLSSSSIEKIDLSHNNISHISHNFFTPIGNTLLELDLSFNRLQNLSKAHFDGMKFLQSLHLENNRLESLDYDTFRGIQSIQMIFFDNNFLRDITPDLFEGCSNLRVLSAHGNRIRALTDSLLNDTKIEILDLGGNALVRFPEFALNRIATTLIHLDVSSNGISSLSGAQLEALTKLRWLNLASNRIVVIAETSFHSLSQLNYLDLSNNPLGRVSVRWFDVVKSHLLHLHLTNMSLDSLPDFDQFLSLLTFNASGNYLTYLPTNFGVNVSTLRTLDISSNGIQAPPNTVWHTIPRLSAIFIRSNPIRVLSNDSFLQLDRLHYLDVSDMPLEFIQLGTFSSLICLKELTFGPFEHENLQPPAAYIHLVESLQLLNLKISEPRLSLELLGVNLPWKLGNITISGPELLGIDSGAFDGVRSPWLKLRLEDTGVLELPDTVFQNLGEATNLDIEIGKNNSILTVIGNPSSAYHPEPFVTFLSSFDLSSDVELSCSCDSGWIEYWLRHWMEQTCPISSATPKEDGIRCDVMLETFRAVNCRDKPGSTLMEAFVKDLDCGWESSATRFPQLLLSPLSLTFLLQILL